MAYHAKHDTPMQALRRRIWLAFHHNRKLTVQECRARGWLHLADLLAVGGAITR